MLRRFNLVLNKSVLFHFIPAVDLSQAARLAHFESVFRAPGEDNFGELGASIENYDGQFEDAEEEVEVDEDQENDENEINDSQ